VLIVSLKLHKSGNESVFLRVKVIGFLVVVDVVVVVVVVGIDSYFDRSGIPYKY
jgi:hypothetical protein